MKNEYENLVDLLTYLVEKEITAKKEKTPQPPYLPPHPQPYCTGPLFIEGAIMLYLT